MILMMRALHMLSPAARNVGNKVTNSVDDEGDTPYGRDEVEDVDTSKTKSLKYPSIPAMRTTPTMTPLPPVVTATSLLTTVTSPVTTVTVLMEPPD